MGLKVEGCVPVEDGRALSYEDFRRRYLIPNRPVVLTGLTQQWRAARDWVTQDGKPDLLFLAQHFGASNVQVADCQLREFTDQKRLDMTVSEYIEYWISGAQGSLLYLKDWHFAKEYPDYGAYETPEFFSDDWLNEYLETRPLHSSESGNTECSDYRFVYMGPKGTWTPLHADVLRSYSWSANICGKKLWHLLSPQQTSLLYDRHGKHTVYDIYASVSDVVFPGFSKTSWIECTQNAGEILFVPSGWYHQVRNLEDAISINHNWFNSCNLHWVWRLLLDDYKETVASIEDVRSISDDFEALCQRNLAANAGMNFDDFVIFVCEMLERRLQRNGGIVEHEEEHSDAAVLPQLVFDLECIASVLESVRNYKCNEAVWRALELVNRTLCMRRNGLQLTMP